MDEDNRSALEQEMVCVSMWRREAWHENIRNGVTDANNCT